jgi:hypothetical protein
MSDFFGADYKVKQREGAAKKRAELDAMGISVESLLNEANLRQWIEKDKYTFAKIARDCVGCDWHLVSMAAKQYGIVNNNSNFRRIYVAKKYT